MVNELAMHAPARDPWARSPWLEQRLGIAVLEWIQDTPERRLQLRELSLDRRLPAASLWMIATD